MRREKTIVSVKAEKERERLSHLLVSTLNLPSGSPLNSIVGVAHYITKSLYSPLQLSIFLLRSIHEYINVSVDPLLNEDHPILYEKGKI